MIAVPRHILPFQPDASSPAPGTYHVSFDEYLSWPAMNQSALKEGRHSMLHLRHALDTLAEPTDAMRLGSALHCAFLEPELLLDRVAVWRGGSRRGAPWDEFRTEHAAKTILTENQYAKLQGMLRSLRAHPAVRQWASRPGEVEVSVVGDWCDVRCKLRADRLTDDPVIDLKTTRTLDARRFSYAVQDYGYHIQGGFYRKLTGRKRFIIIAVENEPPYDVAEFPIDPATLTIGEAHAESLLRGYVQCCETGVWPGMCPNPVTIGLPGGDVPYVAEEECEVRIS